MTTTTIIGITSALVKSRKYKLILVGAQFAYLGYKLLQKRKKEKEISNS